MKSVRHALIKEIIESQEIETQEELAAALRARSIDVTQATVSRDIKELRLLKVLSESGGYKYATADKAEHGLAERFIRIFNESVISITPAGNLIVIKTISGSAHVAGEAIDSLKWAEIVGTISGDNTLLVIAQTAQDAENLTRKFSQMKK